MVSDRAHCFGSQLLLLPRSERREQRRRRAGRCAARLPDTTSASSRSRPTHGLQPPQLPDRGGRDGGDGMGAEPARRAARLRPRRRPRPQSLPELRSTLAERRGRARWSPPLHNYRPLCPAGTLFRDGRVCTDCPTSGSTRPAVRHRCFHDSTIATAAAGPQHQVRRRPRPAASRRADDAEQRHEPGLRRARRARGEARRSWTTSSTRRRPDPEVSDWLFAGRIERDKGLHALIEAWPRGHLGGGRNARTSPTRCRPTRTSQLVGPRSARHADRPHGPVAGAGLPVHLAGGPGAGLPGSPVGRHARADLR